MYERIDEKIKGLAKTVFIIGAAVTAIYGTIILTLSNGYTTYIISGLGYLIIGPLLSWLGSLTLYGFGEIISLLKKSNELKKNDNQE